MSPTGFVDIMVYDPERDVASELQRTRQRYLDDPYYKNWRNEHSFSGCGQYKGDGESCDFTVDDKPGRLRVFIAELPSRHFVEVQEMYDPESGETTMRGLELFRSTLRVDVGP